MQSQNCTIISIGSKHKKIHTPGDDLNPIWQSVSGNGILASHVVCHAEL